MVSLLASFKDRIKLWVIERGIKHFLPVFVTSALAGLAGFFAGAGDAETAQVIQDNAGPTAATLVAVIAGGASILIDTVINWRRERVVALPQAPKTPEVIH